MEAGVIGAIGGEAAEKRLGISEATGLHINVGEADGGIGGVRIERDDFLIFDFGGGEIFLAFVEQAGGKMRLGIDGSEFGGLGVGVESLFGIATFEEVAEREPRGGLSFGDVSRGFERGRGAKELLGFGIVTAGEHESEIEIRFEDIGLGGDGFSVGGDGFVGAMQAVEGEAEIEPGLVRPVLLVIRVIFVSIGQGFFQERFSGGEVVFLDGVFGLGDFGRLIDDLFAMMADGGVGVDDLGEGCAGKNQYE